MGRVLVDAGPLVALLHRDDRDHAECVEVLKGLREPLVSAWAPITEAMHLLDFAPLAQDALLEWIGRGALAIAAVDKDDTPVLRALMQKYRDLPMDLADATLVRIAQRERINTVFTLDRRDFSVYRPSRGRGFRIIP